MQGVILHDRFVITTITEITLASDTTEKGEVHLVTVDADVFASVIVRLGNVGLPGLARTLQDGVIGVGVGSHSLQVEALLRRIEARLGGAPKAGDGFATLDTLDEKLCMLRIVTDRIVDALRRPEPEPAAPETTDPLEDMCVKCGVVHSTFCESRAPLNGLICARRYGHGGSCRSADRMAGWSGVAR